MLTVLGETVIDLLPTDTNGGFRAHPGGSPLNVAVALARLGEPTTLLARTSRSAFGQLLKTHAKTNGVTLAGPTDLPEPATLAVVTLGAGGVAEYDFYLDATVDWQWDAGELAIPAATTVLHTGSLACVREPGATAVTHLLDDLHREGRVLISLDPNIRPQALGDLAAARQRTTQLITTAHVVKASIEDVHTLYPGESVTAVARRWAALGPGLVVITLGPDGALAVCNQHETRRTAPLTDIVDTVGAGDAFTAGLLSALRSLDRATPAALHHLDHDQTLTAIDFAIRVASITCTRAGADPPRHKEL
jgi:fructokinase